MKNFVIAHDLSFRLLISEEDIRHRVRELGREISSRYHGRRPLFLAVLNGAFIFAADLMRACTIDCEVSFIRLRSYQGTESTGEVTERMGLEEHVEGRPVILVEDIIDSGRTLATFLPRLRALNPASIEIAALLVKPDAIRHELPIDYAGFHIEPHFVIGYGLDYDGIGRNWPAIYQLAGPASP